MTNAATDSFWLHWFFIFSISEAACQPALLLAQYLTQQWLRLLSCPSKVTSGKKEQIKKKKIRNLQTTVNKSPYYFNQYLRPNRRAGKSEMQFWWGALLLKPSYSEQLLDCCCSPEVIHCCFSLTAGQICQTAGGAGQLQLCPSHQSPLLPARSQGRADVIAA